MSKTISKSIPENDETMPKIFLEPREKRAQTTQPLNLTEKPVFNPLAEAKTSLSTTAGSSRMTTAGSSRMTATATTSRSTANSSSSSTSTKSYCMARVATGHQCGRNRKE